MAEKSPNIIAQLDPTLVKQIASLIKDLSKVEASLGKTATAFNKFADSFDKSVTTIQTLAIAIGQFTQLASTLSTDITSIANDLKSLGREAVKTKSQIALAFGSTSEIKNFVASMNGLSKQGISAVRVLSGSFVEMSSSLLVLQNTVMKGGGGLSTLSDTFTKIIQASKEFDSFNPAGVKNFTTIVLEMSAKLSTAGFSDSLRLSINAISTFVRSVVSLSSLVGSGVSLTTLRDSLVGSGGAGDNSMLGIIEAFTTRINSMPATTSTLGPGISTSLNSISDIVKTVIRLQEQTAKAGNTVNMNVDTYKDPILDFIGSYFFAFTGALDKFNNVNVDLVKAQANLTHFEPILRTLVNFIEQYVRLGSKRIDVATIQSFSTSLSAITASFAQTLIDVGNTFATAGTVQNDPEILKKLTQYTNLIIKVYRIADIITKVAKSNQDLTSSLSTFGTFIVVFKEQVIEKLSLLQTPMLAAGTGGTDNYKEYISTITRIFNLMGRIAKLTKGSLVAMIEPVQNFGQFLLMMEKHVFEGFAGFANRIVSRLDGASLKKAVDLSRGVLRVMTSLNLTMIELTKLQMPKAGVLGFIATAEAVFVPLSFLVFRLGKIAGGSEKAGNLGAIKKLADSLNSITKFLKVVPPFLRGLTESFDPSQYSLDAIKQGAILKIGGVIKNFVVGFVLPLRAVMLVLPKTSSTINFEVINSMARFIGSIGALGKVNSGQVLANSRVALETAAQIASKIGTVNQVLNATPAARDGSTKGVEGFVKSIAKVSLVSRAPIAIITGLATAIRGFYRAIGTGVRNIVRTVFGINELIRSMQNLSNEARKFSIDKLFNSEQFKFGSAFEDIQYQLEIFGGYTKDNLAQAEEFADFIGIKYPVSANQAMDAILDLAKTGLSLPAIKGVLPSAADLSALSGGTRTLGQSTEFLIAAMLGFKNINKDLQSGFGRIQTQAASDTILRIANATVSTLDDMQLGLQKAAPSANTYGQTLETAAILLSQFNTAQIKAEEGGNLLRTTFAGIFAPKGLKQLAALGISVFDEAGNFRDAIDIFVDLKKSTDRLTERDRVKVITELGDVYARQGINILLASDALKGLQDVAREGMTAEDGATKMMQTFNGVLKQIEGTWQTIYKDVFLPLIQTVFKPLAAEFLKLSNRIAQMSPESKKLIGNVILLGSAMATLLLMVTVVGTKFAILVGGILSLSIVAASAAVFFNSVFTFQQTRDEVNATVASVESFGDRLKAAFVPFLRSLQPVIRSIQEAFTGGDFSKIGDAFVDAYKSFILGIQDLTGISFSETLLQLFTPGANFGSIVAATFNDIFSFLIGSIDVGKILRTFGEIGIQAGRFVLSIFGIGPKDILIMSSYLSRLAKAVGGFVTSRILPFFEIIGRAASPIIRTIVGTFEKFIGVLRRVFFLLEIGLSTLEYHFVKSGILPAIGNAIQKVVDFVQNLFDSIRGGFTGPGVGISGGLQVLAKVIFGLVDIVSGAFYTITDILTNGFDFGRFFGDIFRTIGAILWALPGIVLDVIKTTAQFIIFGLGDLLYDLSNTIGRALGPVFGAVLGSVVRYLGLIVDTIGAVIIIVVRLIQVLSQAAAIFIVIKTALFLLSPFFGVFQTLLGIMQLAVYQGASLLAVFQRIGGVGKLLVAVMGQIVFAVKIAVGLVAVIFAVAIQGILRVAQLFFGVFQRILTAVRLVVAQGFSFSSLIQKIGSVLQVVVGIFQRIALSLQLAVSQGFSLVTVFRNMFTAAKTFFGLTSLAMPVLAQQIWAVMRPFAMLASKFVAFIAIVQGLAVAVERTFGDNFINGIIEGFYKIGEVAVKALGLDSLIDINAARETINLLQTFITALFRKIGAAFQKVLQDIGARFADLRYAIEEGVNSVIGKTSSSVDAYKQVRTSFEIIADPNQAVLDTAQIQNMLSGIQSLKLTDISAAENLINLYGEDLFRAFTATYESLGNKLTPQLAQLASETNLLGMVAKNMDAFDEDVLFDILEQSNVFGRLADGVDLTPVEEEVTRELIRSGKSIRRQVQRGRLLNIQGLVDFSVEGGMEEELNNIRSILEESDLTLYKNEIVTQQVRAERENADFNFGQVFEVNAGTLLDDFRSEIQDTAISAEDLIKKVQTLQTNLNEFGSDDLSGRVGELNRQFIAGAITADEYRSKIAAVVKESSDLYQQTSTTSTAELNELFNSGRITADEFTDALVKLNEERDLLLRRATVYEQTVDIQIRLRNREISADDAAAEIKKITDAVFGRGKSDIEIADYLSTSGMDFIATTPPEQDLALPTEDEGDALKDYQKDIESLDKDIIKSNDKLKEEEEDFLLERTRDVEDFHRDQEKMAEEHQLKLLEIESSTSDDLINAVAERDSAAAQMAVKQRQLDTQQEKDEYARKQKELESDFLFDQDRKRIDYERKKADLQAEIAAAIAERDTKIAALRASVDATMKAEQQKTTLEAQGAAARNKTLAQAMDESVNVIGRFGNAALGMLANFDPMAAQALANGLNVVWAAVRAMAPMIQMAGGTPVTAFNKPKSYNLGSSGLARAAGGSVTPENIYRVGENAPELLRQNNSLYLIPGQRGRIDRPAISSQRKGMQTGSSTMNVNIDLGGITVQGSNMNPQQLIQHVESTLIPRITAAVRKAKS